MITVTVNAVKQMTKLLERTNTEYLRIGITKYGCNGHTYHMTECSNVSSNDEVIKVADDIKVVFSPKTFFYIFGTTIDYSSDNLVSEFIFENPKMGQKCGCGKSFTFEKVASNLR